MNKHQVLGRVFAPLAVFFVSTASLWAQATATPLPLNNPSINFEIKLPHERMEMTVLTSRILTMEQKIPQAQVNNPDLLDLTPLSPTQIQVSAKKAGVTQINLWDEEKKLYTVDVVVYPDAQELTMLLKSQFPNCILKVVPVASSVLLSGYVDKAEHVDKIVQIAQEFYPKVINNMTLGGVQTVLLHVKLMEVSRTKLRRLGMDWTNINGSGTFGSAAGNVLTPVGATTTGLPAAFAPSTTNPPTFVFQVLSGSNTFTGVLDALRKDNLLKILAEPKLVTESGRAASFNSGGEIPVPVPQSLGTVTIEWKKYGAQVDFVPIVLGNGKIRLEVRPRVSELDPARSITINGTLVPGLRSREADTAVEMTAGQTLAIAGLVSSREESENRGLPWISEVPYLGAPFRKVSSELNEVELLIMVTPELVAPMDADEVPPCGPGMGTTSPTDWELYMKGHLEVPNCCPNGDPNAPPPDGMIGPEAGVLTPENRPFKGNSDVGSAQVARRPNGASSQNRYNSSKSTRGSVDSRSGGTNAPPPFVGPVGYDVIK
jgi:pilus assembly protein CpaC